MYSLPLRNVLAAARGPVAGQSYRAEELNRDSLPVARPAPPLEDARRDEEAGSAVEARPLGKERRADDFKLRLKLRKAAIAAEKEKRRAEEAAAAEAAAIAAAEARFAAEDAAAAAAARPVKEKPSDPWANMDLDFDFEGDGKPFRFARGKASRVKGGKEGVRLARAQLRGEEPMKLVEKDGVLRHTGPVTPFGGLGAGGLLVQQEVRTELRDYIAGWVQEALSDGAACWSPEEGLHYASLGGEKLLFDLELLERIRALGVRVSQVCLVDPEYGEDLGAAARQGLREFADWQRAAAQASGHEPAEILVFGSLEDYHETCSEGGRANGCHIFVHCQAAWGESVVLDRRRQMIRGMIAGGLFVRLLNDYSQKQASASLAEPTSAEGWFSMGAWTIAPGKPPSITPIRKTQYAGVLGAIASTPASFVLHAKAQAEARAKAQKEKEKAALQQRLHDRGAQAAWEAEQGPSAAEREEEEQEEEGLSHWHVVFRPHVAVREEPRRTSRIVGALYPGEEVAVAEGRRLEGWLCIRKAPKRPAGSEIPKDSWVLADAGDGQAVFLEPA